MSKTKLTFLTLLIILLNASQTNQAPLSADVPESSFVPLISREITEFELTKAKSEIYYSFFNEFEDSDIIINLKVAKGFTTNCYIYDSYDKIQTNDQGEYINYLKEFSLTEKYTLLKRTEYTLKKTKYYIIIKDILNSYNKDYLTIYNEQDTILLPSERHITIEQFYSKNAFIFSFSHTKSEIVTLELNINNIDFSQFVQIYYEDLDDFVLVYAGEINRGEIKINEDLENQGNYLLLIESLEDPYTDIQSSIILHKDETIVKELKENNPLILSFTGNKVFNFYVDIDEYEYEEENVITFKFGNQVFDRNLLSHCFAKVMNFETNNDNKFLSNMPANEDENEAVFKRLSGTSDIYQLYFKKTLKKEENKKTYLLIHLCLKIEEHDTNEYISPDEFTVYLSNKPEKINLEEYKNSPNILNKNIKLINYIPQIYKIVLPENKENPVKLSYIFYTSENIQVIYNNTMLNKDSNLDEKTKMIYAISPDIDGYDYVNAIYIKLYGFTNKEINFRIESSESLIYYINNDFRKVRTFSDKLTDCSKSFYYVGDYGLFVQKGYLYQETLYGKIITYYKGKVDSSDKTILINDDSKYFVENNLISLETSIDIVELKCDIPGFYQFHLLGDVDKRNINLYSRIYNYLPAGKNFTISPNLRPIEENINFEIYTPKGNEIQISDGEKITKIDSNNKYYQMKYKNSSEIPEFFTVLSKEDTVISITLTNKEPFVIVDKESTHVDYDSQIIVKLDQNRNYESVNIIITRVYHGFSYSLFKGNVDYASKLIESEFDYINIDRSHKINMTISNPYLRDLSEFDEKNVYYVMYSIDDPEMIQKDVLLTYNEIKEYEKMDIGNSKTILNENEKYAMPFGKDLHFLNMVYLSCANSLKEINIYNYNDKIQTIINKVTEPNYQLVKISKNNDYDYQIGINLKDTSKNNLPLLNGAVIGFSDQEISDEDIKKYSNMKLNITQKGNKVEWEVIENMKQYDVFILDENNSFVPYLNNPCFLQSIKDNNTNIYINNNDSYIKHKVTNNNNITIEEKVKCNIIVSTNINGKVPLIYIYDKIIYDPNSIPPEPDDGGDDSDSDNNKDDEDEDGGNGTLIFVAVALPLVIIIVLVLLIVLIKSKKNAVIDLQEPEQPLVDSSRSTRNTQNIE